MATKVLVMLLASHFVPAVDMTSLISSNYAKVFRTGFSNTHTDMKNSGEGNYDRQVMGAELTTESSDNYNVYYPVMEAQAVTEGNGNQTEIQAPSTENYKKMKSLSTGDLLRFNPLASFINAFFRQPVYAADNDEKTEMQHSFHDETSVLPETTEFTSTLKQTRDSYDQSSYEVEMPRVPARGQTPNHPVEYYAELKEEEQNTRNINSKTHPPSFNKFPSFEKESYRNMPIEGPYELNDAFQPTRFETTSNFNRTFNNVTLVSPYKLTALSLPTTSENPHALRESYQPTTLENPYKLLEEQYGNPVPANKKDPREDSTSKHSYSYDSLKSKQSPQEYSNPPVHNSVSSARNYQVATGREKNPYTYFYVGRKLWYVPLFFSVYFMVYVIALVVRSIARHKIVFPMNQDRSSKRDLNSEQTETEEITHQVTTALETTQRLYM